MISGDRPASGEYSGRQSWVPDVAPIREHGGQLAMRFSRTIGLVALSAGLGVTATACSSSPSSSTATTAGSSNAADLALIMAAPAKTLAATTAQASATFNATAGANSLGGTLAGPFNLASGYGNLTLTGSGSLNGLLGGQTNILFVNGTLYLEPNPGSSAAGFLSGSEKWDEINLAAAAGIYKINLGPLGKALETDPADFFKVFETQDETVTKVGTSTVQGQPATEYAVSIDLAAAGKSGPNYLFYAALSQFGSSTSNSDVWLNSNGQIVETKATIPVSSTSTSTTAAGSTATTAAPTTVVVSITLSNFGVTVPPATVPAPALVSTALNGI